MFSKQVEMQPSDSLNGTLQRELRVLETLTTFYAAAGNAPDSDAGLALMAKFLSARAEPQAINAALERCLVECRYPIRLPDILQRLPGTEAGDGNAEMRAAWDVLTSHVKKFGRWNEDYSGAHFAKGSPGLEQRILDVVRRTGGLAVYLGMTYVDREDGKANFPFIQARFFEEYKAWSKVESLDRAKLVPAVPKFAQLTEQKSLATAIDKPKTEAQRQPVGSPEFRRTVSGIMKHIQGPNKFRRRV
jgi:hypothetical protein